MPGAKRRRRDHFFAQHPLCCFCGGGTQSTTEDHIPARGLFLSRCWPEGYVFPACHTCNNSTSKDEFLLAWLVRIRFGDYTKDNERDFERTCRDLLRVAPEIWKMLRIHSRVETRLLLGKARLLTPPLGMDVIHSMTVPPPILEAADRYGVKLAKALHYFHTTCVVPRDAAVKVRVLTNAEAMGADYLDRFLQVITAEPKISRAKTSLKGQFDYRFVVVEEFAASAFVVSFGHSTVMVLMVFCDPTRYEESKARNIFNQQATK
ncbi:MAG: hypothetical protein ACYC4S_06770 [Rhodoferax sp.]